MKGVVIFFTVVIIILICVFAYFATKNMHENFQTNNDSEHPCFNIKIDDNENHKKEAADNNCESVKIGNTQFYVPPSRIAECKDGDVIFASIKDDKSEISFPRGIFNSLRRLSGKNIKLICRGFRLSFRLHFFL